MSRPITHYDVSYQKLEKGNRGEDAKSNWIKIGRGFVNEKGSIDLRFDSLPVPQFWDGRIRLFPKSDG
jgi:hypothetical protein